MVKVAAVVVLASGWGWNRYAHNGARKPSMYIVMDIDASQNGRVVVELLFIFGWLVLVAEIRMKVDTSWRILFSTMIGGCQVGAVGVGSVRFGLGTMR